MHQPIPGGVPLPGKREPALTPASVLVRKAPDRPLARAFSILVCLVLIIFQGGYLLSGVNPSTFLIDAVGAAAIIALPLIMITRGGIKRYHGKVIFALLLGYIVLLMVSTVIYGNPFASKVQAMLLDFAIETKLFAIAFVIFLLLTRDEVEKLLLAVAFIMLAVGVLNFPFVLHDLFATESIHDIPLVRRSGITIPIGLFDHKLKSAQFQLIAMIAGIGISFSPKARQIPGLLAVVGALAVSSMLHLSVKEIVALAAVLMLYTSFRSGKNAGVGAISAIALLVIFMLLVSVQSPIRDMVSNRFSTFLGERGENTVRTAAYIGSFTIATDNFPFGSGASTFMSKGARDLAYSPYYHMTGISRLFGGSPDNPSYLMDTFWPRIIGQAGWPGFIFYLSAILSMLYWSLRRYRVHSSMASYFAVALSVMVFLVSLATPAYTYDHLVMPMAVVLAYVLSQADVRHVIRRTP